jgi:hypothetical protein
MKPLKPDPPPATAEAVPTLAEIQRLAAMLEIFRSLASPPTPPPTDNSPTITAEWAEHVVAALLKQLIRRVPLPADRKRNRPAESCPFTGLNHSQIYEAMEPHDDGRPTIRTISLAEPGEASGARFYTVGSALEYMAYMAKRQTVPPQGQQSSS